MNNVSCDIDEYLKCCRQSGDPQSGGHKLFVQQISAFFYSFVVSGKNKIFIMKQLRATGISLPFALCSGNTSSRNH